MNKKTVVAIYDSRSDARKAVEALNKAGFKSDNISLLSNDAAKEEKFAPYREGTTHHDHHREHHGEHHDDHEGAKKGAAAGGVLGGIAGLLVGLGTLAIPGIGAAVVAGPIASTLIGAGVGAVAGGLVGALMDLGVPEEEAHVYSEAVRRGSTLIALTVPAEKLDRATDILGRFDPVDIERRAAGWRKEGWNRFDHKAKEMDKKTIHAERERVAKEEKIPVVEEELTVGKREVNTGGVRVRSYAVEVPVEEKVRLRDENVHVNRESVNRDITSSDRDKAFKERTIELTERSEEAVVGKKARVKEEVTVSKDVGHHTETVKDKVRHTEVDVDRLDTREHHDRWKKHFQGSLRKNNERFEEFEPAYRFGYAHAGDNRYREKRWEDVRHDLKSAWGRKHGTNSWDRFEPAVQHGYTSHSYANR
jgi:stress response protein YsnF